MENEEGDFGKISPGETASGSTVSQDADQEIATLAAQLEELDPDAHDVRGDILRRYTALRVERDGPDSVPAAGVNSANKPETTAGIVAPIQFDRAKNRRGKVLYTTSPSPIPGVRNFSYGTRNSYDHLDPRPKRK